MLFILLLFGSAMLLPASVGAVPPPDFLFSVGSQLGIFFSVALVFLSGFTGLLLTAFRSLWHTVKRHPVLWGTLVFVILILSLLIGWGLDQLWR